MYLNGDPGNSGDEHDVDKSSKSAAQALVLTDMLVADVADELAAIRAKYDIDVADLHFYTRVLGGKWTKKHRKKTADGIAGFPRGELGHLFCRKFKWPKKRSYYFSKYSEEGAMQLAQQFVLRSSYFLESWIESDFPEAAFRFTAADIERYDDIEFVEWLIEQDVSSPCFSAGQKLRKLVPFGVGMFTEASYSDSSSE